MCGIFGIITKSNSSYNTNLISNVLKDLARMSERRGKDSSGLCINNKGTDTIEVIKGPVTTSKLFSSKTTKSLLQSGLESKNMKQGICVFGHARLVTNGTQLNDDNNQPIVRDGIIAVHNGIVANDSELWEKHKVLKRAYEIDTEVLLAIINEKNTSGLSIEESVLQAIDEIEGTASLALMFSDHNKFVLATNNGSLYYLTNENDVLLFASERNTINKVVEKNDLAKKFGKVNIKQVQPNTGLIIDLFELRVQEFNRGLSYTRSVELEKRPEIKQNYITTKGHQINVVLDINQIKVDESTRKERDLLIYPMDKIRKLRRCKKCVLPETFPFLSFDNKGVCNYCNNYKLKNQQKPENELVRLVDAYRSKDGSPDCIIPLSGGRDSTYVLHYAKKVLGLNPITLTYDWGMVTDLARRNIARICGKLGVENIIVAADIHWKRENIHKNVKAWLNKPELGMIPLFMSGDKYFYYYANKIKEENNIKLNILGINDLENTDFKVGFAGIAPRFDKDRIYSMTLQDKLKLFKYVGGNFITNPGYLNQSLLDSFGSIISRYFTHKRDYYHLFDYLKWDEKEVEETIIKEYNWEKAIDTKSTWRIGDGTASFYNYIYTLVAGFSENDTFRSNQVREGMITREEALNLVYEENNPRYNSIKWYLEILNLNYTEVISKINTIKPIY
jgi:hypothetical protein